MMPKVSWELKEGNYILPWRERGRIREGFLEEIVLEVSVDI